MELLDLTSNPKLHWGQDLASQRMSERKIYKEQPKETSQDRGKAHVFLKSVEYLILTNELRDLKISPVKSQAKTCIRISHGF